MRNFIDQTFTIISFIILKVFPAEKKDKKSYAFYRQGMQAQSEGRYQESLDNYYEALQYAEDPYDRSYILYNIGLIYANIGKVDESINYYNQAIELNGNLPQALNNIAVIYHLKGTQLLKSLDSQLDIDELIQFEKDQPIYYDDFPLEFDESSSKNIDPTAKDLKNRLDTIIKDKDEAKEYYDKAAEYWRRAIKLAPDSYPEAQNWLKTTGRL